MNDSIEAGGLARHAGWGIDRLLRARLIATLGELRGGRIRIEDAFGTTTVGTDDDTANTVPLRLRVDDLAFYRAIAVSGSVGAGEAYMDGHWRCDDLVGLVRLLVRNRDLLDRMETGMAWFGGMAMRGWHALRRNSRDGSRRNIAAHYDLGNAFFELFLSADLMYSSAMWRGDPDADVVAGDDESLDAASTRKLERICDKLRLQRGDRVIEIGTGWGGFAIHAARHHGCHVTTTTISREQHALASRRVAEAGLSDRVTLLMQDYRDLDGQFDKLVSIEMVEAIGAPFLDTYFARIGALLKPDGLALVQAITIEDHRYAQALRTVDFIKRHVFPGSFIPSIAALVGAKARSSDLGLVHLEDFGQSYALTLQAWRRRFMARLHDVRRQGYDERFIRMWEFYLAYCEGAFREGSIGVSQLLMAKPRSRRASSLAWVDA